MAKTRQQTKQSAQIAKLSPKIEKPKKASAKSAQPMVMQLVKSMAQCQVRSRKQPKPRQPAKVDAPQDNRAQLGMQLEMQQPDMEPEMSQLAKERKNKKQRLASKKARDKKRDEDQVLNDQADKKIEFFKRFGLAKREVLEPEAYKEQVKAARERYAEQDIVARKFFEAIYPELKQSE